MKLSVSSFNKYQGCKRLYYIEKVLGYRDLTPKPWLEFGSNFDALMELVDTRDANEVLGSVNDIFKDPFQAAEAEYLVRKWQQKYSEDPQPPIENGNQYEINVDLSHHVEDRFELIFTGYIDKVYEEDSEPAINERKTTKDPINETSVYWNRLLFDPQIVGYSFGLSSILGVEVNNVTYEAFRKPQKAVDSVLFTRGTNPTAYREKLLKGLYGPVKRSAEMVNRKKVFITDELREQWLYEFVGAAEEIHAKNLLSKEMDQPELEWTRNAGYCDKFLPCVYKPFCGCNSRLEDIQYIAKR